MKIDLTSNLVIKEKVTVYESGFEKQACVTCANYSNNFLKFTKFNCPENAICDENNIKLKINEELEVI